MLEGPSPDATLRNVSTTGTNVSVTTDEDGQATVELQALNGFNSEEVEFKGDFDGDGTMGTPTIFSGRSAENASLTVSPSGSPPVTLTNATLTASNAVNLTVRNDGYARSVTAVRVSEVTVEDEKEVVGSVNMVTSLLNTVSVVTGVQTGMTNTTDVVDGPDELAGMGVETTPVAFATLSEEGGPPATAPSTVTGRTIAGGEEVNVTLVLNSSVTEATSDGNFGAGDALPVTVTLVFDDGYRETYAVRVETPEDDHR